MNGAKRQERLPAILRLPHTLQLKSDQLTADPLKC